ncbi:MAG: sensor histidine kinase [Polaromonas sp.]
MHPVTSTPPRLPLWGRAGSAVLANLLIAAGLTAVRDVGFGWNLLYSQCIGLSIWALIELGRHRFIHHPDTQSARLVLIVPLAVGLGYTAGMAVADAVSGFNSWQHFMAQPRSASTGLLLLSLVAGSVITYYFLSREQLARERERTTQAQRQATEAQLKLLQTQLAPHMLFNTLANLRALIGTHPERATDMLDRLVAYLRATLQASRATTHPLQAEFDRLQDYLALMAVRLGPRLAFTLDLPAALAQQHVPTLLLQPLVENSLQHALEPHIQGGRITVSAQQQGAQLVLQVHDTGTAADLMALSCTDATGFGLRQVRERLATRYGSAASLHFSTPAQGGLLASLTLPIDAINTAP